MSNGNWNSFCNIKKWHQNLYNILLFPAQCFHRGYKMCEKERTWSFLHVKLIERTSIEEKALSLSPIKKWQIAPLYNNWLHQSYLVLNKSSFHLPITYGTSIYCVKLQDIWIEVENWVPVNGDCLRFKRICKLLHRH